MKYKIMERYRKSVMKPNRRKFSLVINNILNECSKLENPEQSKVSKYMEKQIRSISSAFSQLKHTDLNPTKFEASRAYQNGKKRLSAYLHLKEKKHEGLNKEKLKKILIEESPKNKSKLTFENINEEAISYLVTKNKRKFAEGWRKGFSTQVSPFASNLPSISSSPKGSPNNTILNQKISTMINKELGILPRKKTIYRKKSIKKKENKVKKEEKIDVIDVINMDGIGEHLEERYLHAEYKSDNENVANKLKIQKIIKQKHAQDRRASAVIEPYNNEKDFSDSEILEPFEKVNSKSNLK